MQSELHIRNQLMDQNKNGPQIVKVNNKTHLTKHTEEEEVFARVQ